MKRLGLILFAQFLLCGFVRGSFIEPMRFFYPQGNYIRKLESKNKPKTQVVTLYSNESTNSQKKIARKAILVVHPNAKANVVISHGFMCDKYDVGFLRQLFPQGKYNFLTFDFRAHGENINGQCCTFGRDEANEVVAAANYFKSHETLKNLPTLGYGFSMGAVATIEAQAKNPNLFKGLVLDCPFDSTENVIKKALQKIKFSFFGYEFDVPGRAYLEKYAFHPYVQSFIKFLLKTVPHMDPKNIQTYMYKFSPAESAHKLEVPCLFIHCKNDEKVAVDAIRTIYKNTNGPKKLWVTNGRGHYDSMFFNPEKYSAKINNFLEHVLNGGLSTRGIAKVVEDKDDPLEQQSQDGERV